MPLAWWFRTPGRRGMAVGFAALALAGALPFALGGSDVTMLQLDYVGVIVIMAIGLNVIFGFAGELAIGSGGLLAVGGYAAAIAANHFPTHVGLLAMCVIGAAAGALLGLVIALPSLRISGFYLALVSLFVAEVVPEVAEHISWTGGFEGISLVGNVDFTPALTGRDLYAVIVGIVALCVLAVWLLRTSTMGRRLVTLKTGEVLAGSLGIARYSTKVGAFVISSLFGGLAGGVYTYAEQFFSPGSATTNTSEYVLAACVVGGLGTVWGPVLGGIVIGLLSQFVGRFDQYEGIVFGGLLVVVAIAAPGGLVELWRQHAQRPGLATREKTRAAPAIGVLRTTPVAEQTDRSDQVASLRIAAAVRRFGGVQAVGGLDLIVRPATVHGLVGSNGSGKSTLLNLISGFYPLDGGSIWIGADRLDGRRPDQVARLGIARSFQTPIIMMGETVLTNVLVAGELDCGAGSASSMLRTPRGRRGLRTALDRARQALELMGLDPVAGRTAGELPHGTLRLVEIARALALRPRFLLLDEPAAGLSAAEVDMLQDSVRRIRDRGVGVLLVEHNVPLVRSLADEVTVMHFGQKLAGGHPSVLETDPRVSAVFLGVEPAMAGTEAES